MFGSGIFLNDEVQMLRKLPLFARADPCKLKRLAFVSKRLHYGPGETLFCCGDEGDSVYVILQGTAAVLVPSAGGEPVQVAELGSNDVVGEIAVLCDGMRTATVRAATPLDVLRIGKDVLLRMLNDNPGMALEVMRALAERLSNTTSELIAARSDGAPVPTA